MVQLLATICAILASAAAVSSPNGHLDMLTDSLIHDIMSRLDGTNQNLALDEDLLQLQNDLPEQQMQSNERSGKQTYSQHPFGFQTRDDLLLPREPVPRKEYLEQSSLWGHQYVQGGAGEGSQRLKPDGSVKNVQVIKTDAVLPAYCNPPNPCPIGYTSEDGCLEEFLNTASFSREYQASQECMCDTEHMFDCPGNNDENELESLARSIQNEGLMDSTLDKIVANLDSKDHKVVAKKFFSKKSHEGYLSKFRETAKRSERTAASLSGNPFLKGDQLPVVAKKSPHLAKGGLVM